MLLFLFLSWASLFGVSFCMEAFGLVILSFWVLYLLFSCLLMLMYCLLLLLAGVAWVLFCFPLGLLCLWVICFPGVPQNHRTNYKESGIGFGFGDVLISFWLCHFFFTSLSLRILLGCSFLCFAFCFHFSGLGLLSRIAFWDASTARLFHISLYFT